MVKYQNIKTNIISGFLGAGKTTAIQHLISIKPADETWAVIVNEFGQVGVDGKLIENQGVAIKEIPGGCLCCTTSQSFNVGLNQIIKQYHPQRILIEPTGLGHPEKLIQNISNEYYKDVLDLKAVINLLDARHLSDERYLQHETFQQQIELADILLASKMDLYSEIDRQNFYQFVESLKFPKTHYALCQKGEIPLEWLDMEHDARLCMSHQSAGQKIHLSHQHVEPVIYPASKHWQIVEGKADGFYSVSWQAVDEIHSSEKIIDWLNQIREQHQPDRIKAIFHIEGQWLSVNMTAEESQVTAVNAQTSNILEIISSTYLPVNSITSTLEQFFTTIAAECTGIPNVS